MNISKKSALLYCGIVIAAFVLFAMSFMSATADFRHAAEEGPSGGAALEDADFARSRLVDLEGIYADSIIKMALISGALIAVTILAGEYFIFVTLKPLKELSGVLKNVSEGGDLTRRLKVRGDDEISGIAKTFNSFMEEMSKTVSAAKNAADMVTQSVSEVMLNTDASLKVSDNVKGFSSIVTEQARGIEGFEAVSAGFMKGYSGLPWQISEAVTVIDKIVENKENGERSLSALIEKNSAEAESNKKAAVEIDELRSQITCAAQIAAEIKTVSERMELLSESAFQEASASGEYGRGFAAVTAAVKVLAGQSLSSAFKIGKIIASMSQKSEGSAEAMTCAARVSEERNACMERMRETFLSISSEADAVNSIFGNIHRSLSEAAAMNAKMHEEVRNVREMGLENKRNAESAGESMNRDAIENIKDLSNKLASTINGFKGILERFEVDG